MRPYVSDDYARLASWYNARGIPVIAPDAIPALGLIEPEVAAGFLYQTDAKGLCLIEEFISNPEAPIKRRAEALELIAGTLLDTAKNLGFTRVISYCKSRGIQRLAARFGMQLIATVPIWGKEF